MMIRPPRVAGALRLGVVAAALALLWLLVVGLFLPYDNPLLLSLRFTTHRLGAWLRPAGDHEAWVFRPPRHPVDIDADAALVIKTGYGTQHRLPAQLDALGLFGAGRSSSSNRGLEESTVVIGDFSAVHRQNGHRVEVHDMVAATLATDALAGLQDTERVDKFRKLRQAIRIGDEDEARDIGQRFGWELDAMKVLTTPPPFFSLSTKNLARLFLTLPPTPYPQFISGLEMAYRKMPDKKWYIMIDDDTLIVRASLQLVLGHMDPARPVYLGNAVGDYRGRFAHGGSALALSRAALARLFDDSPGVVADAHVRSLTETWGDRLIATALLRVGVYLDERYSHFFNGEPPRLTRLRPGRLCSPIVSFHQLARPERMREAGAAFGAASSSSSSSAGYTGTLEQQQQRAPLFWHQLWSALGQPGMDEFARDPIRPGEDHVGAPDDESVMTTSGVASADACRKACARHHRSCLAWTWEQRTGLCHVAPWLIAGERRAAEGKYSGLNAPRVKMLLDKCGRR